MRADSCTTPTHTHTYTLTHTHTHTLTHTLFFEEDLVLEELERVQQCLCLCELQRRFVHKTHGVLQRALHVRQPPELQLQRMNAEREMSVSR